MSCRFEMCQPHLFSKWMLSIKLMYYFKCFTWKTRSYLIKLYVHKWAIHNNSALLFKNSFPSNQALEICETATKQESFCLSSRYCCKDILLPKWAPSCIRCTKMWIRCWNEPPSLSLFHFYSDTSFVRAHSSQMSQNLWPPFLMLPLLPSIAGPMGRSKEFSPSTNSTELNPRRRSTRCPTIRFVSVYVLGLMDLVSLHSCSWLAKYEFFS